MVFDSSAHIHPDSFAINDWTSPDTEPEVTFATAFLRFLIWMWNLRATYPFDAIMIGDDDISGAFRLVKYNPHLVAMHSFLMGGYLGMNTGLTFGDNTSPSLWQAIATAREEMAHHLWNDPNVIQEAAQYLPDLHFSSPADQDISNLARANTDALNPGVLDKDGKRIAPDYPMHVPSLWSASSPSSESFEP